MRRIALALCALLALAGALAACGSDEAPTTETRPTETVDELPELPPGWRERVNFDGGFAYGLPPGWTASADGAEAVLRSEDRLLAVSITPDRSRAAQEIPLPEFASRAASALGGLRRLDFTEPRPLRHRYEAYAVSGSGVAEATGIPQRLLLVALRRPEIVTVVAFGARNQRHTGRSREREIERVIRTIRTRPL